MRVTDFYSQIVRDGRHGRPTMREVRADYRRSFDRHVRVYVNR